VGSYVDAYFEGTLDKFIDENPEIFKRNGELKSDYIQAEQIIRRIEQDDLMMQYMSGRKQVIMTGKIADVDVKIKIDFLHDDKIVDGKVRRDFESVYVPEQGRLTFIEAWGYDLQGAVYQEIVRQNTGKKLPFYIAGPTKEKVTDIGIFHISQNILDFELERFSELAPAYNLIKQGIIPPERCEKCDYCKSTKKLTKIIGLEELAND
ncbi:MAG: PD-(D/E)XK nuclease-like domain-containing protein, partial [Clostridia bacterium]|nr:PD-(D/E)XK nuclease-like domain-containing protein [Clostridia bacterium]